MPSDRYAQNTNRARPWALYAGRKGRKMTIYSACTIRPADSGFGMWQRGEKAIGPETSYADLNDLIMDGEMIDLDAALADEDFIEAGIEDIRGRIYNEPGRIYAVLGEEGDGSPCVRYFGVEEDEVPEDFFD
jgi:hypothetical protein